MIHSRTSFMTNNVLSQYSFTKHRLATFGHMMLSNISKKVEKSKKHVTNLPKL